MKADPVCCCEVHPELGLGLEFNESGPAGRLDEAALPSESTSIRLDGTITAATPAAAANVAEGGGFVLQGGRSRLA